MRLVTKQVIDGADSTLDAMERVPVNTKNRPLNEIRTTHVRASHILIPSHKTYLPGLVCFRAEKSRTQPRTSRLMRRPFLILHGHGRDALTSSVCFHALQVTIHANPIADAQLAGR